MSSERFSRARALQVLDQKAKRVAEENKFNRSHGTAQLRPPGDRHGLSDKQIARAVEYGRMRAFEEFACSIEENFRFESNT